MKLKIAAVGSSPLIAGEILDATKFIVGDEIDIKTYSTYEIQNDTVADIYICAQTQLKSLKKIIPDTKIVLLDLIPTAKFFIAVARIPRGETIYLFNNQLEYTTILAEYCEKLGITEVNFLPIAYEEMPKEEVIARLKEAKYIIGVDKFVGNDVLQAPKYVSYLRPDLTIIPGTRVASVHSACALLQCIATNFHKCIDQGVADIAAKLKLTPTHSEKELGELHQEVDELALYSTKAIDVIQNAVIKSVVNHVSPDVAILDTSTEDSSKRPILFNSQHTTNHPICDSLESITELNHTLLTIAKKLAKLT
ncbi:hypothetical protein [Anaerosinus massiliensis]|uniref:hypothetical protein n=1 Tax=Massilibacillus massiliensis TaxID=1806837 RepID=UPI000DA5F816|nr:hypothetical protein [Massilibacillus massiliensis]